MAKDVPQHKRLAMGEVVSAKPDTKVARAFKKGGHVKTLNKGLKTPSGPKSPSSGKVSKCY